jgi:CRP/FNR family transcriptional regulator
MTRWGAVSRTVVSLKAQPLFAALDQAELLSLADRAHLRRYAQGEVLFAEGSACQGLYVLVSGRVKIFKTSASGREQVLAVEEPGSSFAELPVFDGGPYPASASAMSDTEVLFISRADVRALCLERPEVALKILQVVAARQRRVVAVIEELSFTTVRHRLVSWLLRQATSNGRRTERGTTITLPSSHQELAAHVGTVRELVSRNLTRLQAQGFIAVEAREITILDPEGLEADLTSSV